MRVGVVCNAGAGGAVDLLHGEGKVALEGAAAERCNHGLSSGSGPSAEPWPCRWDCRR